LRANRLGGEKRSSGKKKKGPPQGSICKKKVISGGLLLHRNAIGGGVKRGNEEWHPSPVRGKTGSSKKKKGGERKYAIVLPKEIGVRKESLPTEKKTEIQGTGIPKDSWGEKTVKVHRGKKREEKLKKAIENFSKVSSICKGGGKDG